MYHQDDESDWRTKATKMAGIYANAELVISAASSSGGTSGLFNTRKPVEIITPKNPRAPARYLRTLGRTQPYRAMRRSRISYGTQPDMPSGTRLHGSSKLGRL
jgi:hypothetical protein